jgi:hypothetical protein
MIKIFLAMAILSASLLTSQAQNVQGSGADTAQEKDLIAGKVSSVSKDSFTVKRQSGNTIIVQVSERTKIREQTQQQPVKLEPRNLADVKVGDRIAAVGTLKNDVLEASRVLLNPMPIEPSTPAATGGIIGGFVIHAEDIGVSYIIGDVKAIHDSRLTILRTDGKTQEIEVDDNTLFKKGTQRITLHDVKVGDSISGPGKLKDTVFVLQQLYVDRPAASVHADQPQENRSPATPASVPAK